MSRKEKAFDNCAFLEDLYRRWDNLHEHGGSDPFWSDGSNANMVRNMIIHTKEIIEKENSLFLLPDCFYREIPPELPRDYMARPDEIRENARKAMEIIDADEDLKFVREQSINLSKKQLDQLCIPAILGYPETLRSAIAEDDLITMRRYENPDRYLISFSSAAEKLRSPEKINERSAAYDTEDEEEFEDDFEEEYSETEQLETEEISQSVDDSEEDLQLNFF